MASTPSAQDSTSNISLAKPPYKSKYFLTPLSIASSSSKTLPNTTGLHAPSPHRTFSDPCPPPSPALACNIQEPLHRASTEGPNSVGYEGKNVKFGFAKHEGEGDRRYKPDQWRKVDPLKRRHSNENHVNVYTDCGRHGDDWLFRGWSVGGAVKRAWGRK